MWSKSQKVCPPWVKVLLSGKMVLVCSSTFSRTSKNNQRKRLMMSYKHRFCLLSQFSSEQSRTQVWAKISSSVSVSKSRNGRLLYGRSKERMRLEVLRDWLVEAIKRASTNLRGFGLFMLWKKKDLNNSGDFLMEKKMYLQTSIRYFWKKGMFYLSRLLYGLDMEIKL